MSSQKHGPYLIAGLGNPGRGYRGNRHNVGFMVLDQLADHLRTGFRQVKSKALVTEGRWQDHKVLLAKPQTMMNLSGESIGPLARYYRVPLHQLIVVYDDLDLPHGALRMRPGGGSGGHRGLRSVIRHLGDEGFPRLRVGIGRPPGRMDPADYVLQDFSEDELASLEITFQEAVDCLHHFVREDIDVAMSRCNDS